MDTIKYGLCGQKHKGRKPSSARVNAKHRPSIQTLHCEVKIKNKRSIFILNKFQKQQQTTAD